MPHILEFPSEILHNILVFATIARHPYGISRCLRLKLVCKKFCAAFRPALFESRVLDSTVHNRHLSSWRTQERHSAQRLWQSYFAYRARNEQDPMVGHFVEIRSTAVDFSERTGADFDETLDALCWLALDKVAWAPTRRWNWYPVWKEPNEMPDPKVNLLSTAAHLNHLPLARSLLSEGLCPTSNEGLFWPPIQLAAVSGNADMLRLFQEHLPDYETLTWNTWRGKTGPGAIIGAAQRGDMEMVRLAVYPPSRTDQDTSKFAGFPVGHVDKKSPQGVELDAARQLTRNLDVFWYLCSFFEDQVTNYGLNHVLSHHAEYGNVQMVRGLLDAGVDVDGKSDAVDYHPLSMAARNCHEEIVDLLLQRGADVNYEARKGTAIVYAAVGGSLDIVRKLLAHGAMTREECFYRTLIVALRCEHTDMVELLLRERRDMDPRALYKERKAMWKFVLEGRVDSMVDLMRQRYGPEDPSFWPWLEVEHARTRKIA